MQTRTLGQNGITVSSIGFGCMGLNYHRGPAPDRAEMIALVRAAAELSTFRARETSIMERAVTKCHRPSQGHER